MHILRSMVLTLQNPLLMIYYNCMAQKILSKEEYKKKLTEMLKKDKAKYAKFGIDLKKQFNEMTKTLTK